MDDKAPEPTQEELLDVLNEMIKNIEQLPPHAMILPINHYDFCSLMIWLSAFARSCRSSSNF